ncbi:hypothetical protein D3C80_1625090 [compost metagenome]
MQAQRVRVEAGRVEGVAIIGAPQFGAGVVGMARPLPPVIGAVAVVIEGLAVEADAIGGCGDQPALSAQAVGKVRTGIVQDVVGGLVIGDQVQLQSLGQRLGQGDEAHESMQVVRLTANLFDPPVQLTAQAVAREHGGAIAMGDAPEHFVQQVPALRAAIAGGLCQLAQ